MERVDTVRELLLGITSRMGVKVELRGSIVNGEVQLKVTGDREGLLIGRHGRTLEALRVLVRQMASKRLGIPLKVSIDVNGYLQRRAERLTRMAKDVGERVKRDGRAVTIGPFSAYDRRTIHMALRDDNLVKTESIGEGPLKRITILPRDKGENGAERS